MRPGGRELESAASSFLAAHVGEVGQGRLLELLRPRRRRSRDLLLAAEVGDRLREVPDRDDVDAGSAASGADSAAQSRRLRPALRAPSATAIVPATGRTRPSSASSPRQRARQLRRGQLLLPARTASAIGRSNPEPSLRNDGRREVDGDPRLARPRAASR